MKTLIILLSTFLFIGCGSSSTNKKNNSATTITQTSTSEISTELKNTLSYMGNEERLAYDIYLRLYQEYPITQFYNIAMNSETKHIQEVQKLVNTYVDSYDEFTNTDLNELAYKDTSVSNMESGVYDIQKIQELYDNLIALGLQSELDALKVGCMVEVVDINDLLEYIELAEKENATEVVSSFELLRDGSYKHYWAFDSALTSRGYVQGCCIAGDEYCHPEYPNN